MSDPTACDEASDIDHGPPTAAMSSRVAGSERSACASNSGHGSGNMLRNLFLLRVFSQVKKPLCAASDLAASISGGLSATASSASGMPSAVLAMTIAPRSSVLASPANSFEAPCAASPGRYARGIPASLVRESASEPMLRTWSTTTSAPGYCA